MCSRWFLCSLVVLASAGCGPPARDAELPDPSPAFSAAADPAQGGSEAALPDQASAPGDTSAVEPTADLPPVVADDLSAPAPGTERVVAEKGVGIKGRSLDEHEGMIVTPAKTYFTVRERIIFEVTLPSNLKLFEATHGRFPRSHEEFMEQVIEANGVRLPDLPPGQRYVYDPETHELMVERPQR